VLHSSWLLFYRQRQSAVAAAIACPINHITHSAQPYHYLDLDVGCGMRVMDGGCATASGGCTVAATTHDHDCHCSGKDVAVVWQWQWQWQWVLMVVVLVLVLVLCVVCCGVWCPCRVLFVVAQVPGPDP
jgi:hypothetical protein